MYVEIAKSKRHYRLCSGNGQVMTTSQRYFSKWNCKRAANKLAKRLGVEVRYAS